MSLNVLVSSCDNMNISCNKNSFNILQNLFFTVFCRFLLWVNGLNINKKQKSTNVLTQTRQNKVCWAKTSRWVTGSQCVILWEFEFIQTDKSSHCTYFLYRELDNLQTAAHKSLYARLYTSGVVYNQRFFHNVNSSLIKVMFNPNMNNNK